MENVLSQNYRIVCVTAKATEEKCGHVDLYFFFFFFLIIFATQLQIYLYNILCILYYNDLSIQHTLVQIYKYISVFFVNMSVFFKIRLACNLKSKNIGISLRIDRRQKHFYAFLFIK